MHRRSSAVGLVFAFLTSLAVRDARAVAIDGIDFSSWETIDASGGVDLTLHTLEDLYVFIPNGLPADDFTLIAEDRIVIEEGVTFPFELNDPLLCAAGCALEDFDRAGDVVLRIFEPLGNVSLSARNVVVSAQPIPEPSSFSLVALGLLAFSCWRSDVWAEKVRPRKCGSVMAR